MPYTILRLYFQHGTPVAGQRGWRRRLGQAGYGVAGRRQRPRTNRCWPRCGYCYAKATVGSAKPAHPGGSGGPAVGGAAIAQAQIGKRFPSERKVVQDPVTGTGLTFLTSTSGGDMALDAAEDVVHFRVGKAEAARR